MRLSLILLQLFRFLLPPCVIFTLCLYFYPVLYGCAFPAPQYASPEPSTCFLAPSTQQEPQKPTVSQAGVAPFRLLVFGDPQLEGDSSLPSPDGPIFSSLHATREKLRARKYSETLGGVGGALEDFLRNDIPRLFKYSRKRLDLLGNDYYLAHIYRALHWWTQPTHVTVLGDLLGSQWISDAEFQRRSWRFWHRVFRHARKVDANITSASHTETLGADPGWARRVINVAGNHDVGYAGDLDEARVARFEHEFGAVNWDVSFAHPLAPPAVAANNSDSGSLPDVSDDAPSIRLVILNSMNLDTPALAPSLQTATYDFLNAVIRASAPVSDRRTLTILLTHIPLHKEAGVCADAPFFDFFSAGEGGGIREQNHVSAQISRSAILEGVFGISGNSAVEGGGRGRSGIVLTGHDHEGCDVYHYLARGADGEERAWRAVRWDEAGPLVADEGVPGVREVTLRSMMGEYGGYAGLVSAWFDEAAGEWRVDVATCALGVQHIWWAVHVADLVVALLGLAALLALWWEWRTQDAARRGIDSVKQVEEKERATGVDGSLDVAEPTGVPKGGTTPGHGTTQHGDPRSQLLKDW